ncbi:hypothetical protein F66182_3739 [Fusarium sp. NRRL 66182]|nr:hypothetical protein F66182_3739 [Fusarium sp. NRRL 66182]
MKEPLNSSKEPDSPTSTYSDYVCINFYFIASFTTLSQSTGWADCIALAMAPVGVITIIVSAIRVTGPRWLKAVVGRARENVAAAEIEVMSWTSPETCELWNNKTRAVVRCPGTTDNCELICIYSTSTTASGEVERPIPTTVKIMDIKDAVIGKDEEAGNESDC